jgi:hypothetical protein
MGIDQLKQRGISTLKFVRPRFFSAAAARRLMWLRFPGRVSVVVQNGRVLKSGYEQSHFRHGGEAYRLDCGRRQYRKMKR